MKYKLEVLGHFLRIVEDTGSEFEDDFCGFGDCRDPKSHERAELVLRLLNQQGEAQTGVGESQANSVAGGSPRASVTVRGRKTRSVSDKPAAA